MLKTLPIIFINLFPKPEPIILFKLLIIHVMEKFQFHYSVAYSAPLRCKKLGNNPRDN